MESNSPQLQLADKYLEQIAIAKLWQHGVAYIDSFGNAIHQIRRPWIIRHIKTLASAEPEYLAKYASFESLRKRVESLPGVHSWIGARPLMGGKLNFLMYLHRIAGPEGERDILEKIYHKKNESNHKREVDLLSESRELGLPLPQILGATKFGEFCSVFLEYIHGKEPSEQEFTRRLHEAAFIRLWSVQAPLSLQKAPFTKGAVLDEMQVKERRDKLSLEGSGGDDFKALLSDELINRLLRIYNDSPYFICHEDLHRGNFLKVRESEFVILDWDKWRLERVGAGFSPEESRLHNIILTDDYRDEVGAIGAPLQFASNFLLHQILSNEGAPVHLLVLGLRRYLERFHSAI